MGADRVLRTSYTARLDTAVHEALQYEPFGLRGRKLSAKEKVKKGIFLFSLVAAAGYYLFLLILFLLR
ncbi:MAG: hypothetical protein JXB06_08535 [Spirochaetales bacterium]|nr:hypothetical protein [Spirochaetales bacterium]